MSYLLRGIDLELWRAFKTRAKAEGRPLRWIILELVKRYAARELDL